MTLHLATIAVWFGAAYLALGLTFAVPFAVRWAGRLDPAATRGTWGFRVLIVPGAVLLWPVLAARLARAR
jgi:hypothetical protein